MNIIPVINCSGFECVKKRLQQIKELKCEWMHFDISDGKFAPTKTWNEPKKISSSNLKIEVHLMVEKSEDFIGEWIAAGARRVLVHQESSSLPSSLKSYGRLRSIALATEREAIKNQKCELGLALKPETAAEDLFPYLGTIRFVLLLAVFPGCSGQKFQRTVLEKIKKLKNYDKTLVIEVDGGINLETAKLVKSAGTDIAASASYIFENKDIVNAFRQLKRA